MHVDVFDQYKFRDSFLHHLDPRVKVILAVVFILSNAILPDGSWFAFLVTWFLILILNEIANLGLGYTLKRSYVVLPFLVVAVSAIFSPEGNPLARIDLGFIALIPTDFGIIRFLSILIRSWLSVQLALILVAITQFPSLIHAFEHLMIPRVITTIIAFLYRYLFVLTDEAQRMMRAREARSAAIPGMKRSGNLIWRIRTVGNMAGQLFLRSYDRSDRIYQAMLSRGYAGYMRTLKPHDMEKLDWMTLLMGLTICAVVQIIGWIS